MAYAQGIYSNDNRLALHRFKADESYLIGAGKKPFQAHLDMFDVIPIALGGQADAVHPGYGLLSEEPDLAVAGAVAGLRFVCPTPEITRSLGNKVMARNAAVTAAVQLMAATGLLPLNLAATTGDPLMLKAS